jgi:hypothetical protein
MIQHETLAGMPARVSVDLDQWVRVLKLAIASAVKSRAVELTS